MQTLFSTQKVLYAQALLQATGHDLIRSSIANILPQLQPEQLTKITIFLKQTVDTFAISLCSQDTTLLTILKLNSSSLADEISSHFIDKNLLPAHTSINLSIYRR
jgi:hypothetical protein